MAGKKENWWGKGWYSCGGKVCGMEFSECEKKKR